MIIFLTGANLNKGHGTLNAIYASVQKACEVRGWDGIDLLVIGGDFQVKSKLAAQDHTSFDYL